MDLLINIILQFVVTFILEFLIVWAFIRKDVRKIALYTLLINLFTWPLANLFSSYGAVAVETGVTIIESILIMLLFEKKYLMSLLVSFVANLVSFALGYLAIIFISNSF